MRRLVCAPHRFGSGTHARCEEYTYGVEALTGVYLGAAMRSDEKDLIGHILHGCPTQIYEVRRRADAFKLDIVHMTYTPYQYTGPS